MSVVCCWPGFSGMLAHVVEFVFQAVALSFRHTRYHMGTENDKREELVLAVR